MKIVLGVALMGAGVVLSVWLAIWVMLYGGIMQAVGSFGVDNPAVVWGIIRAVFSGLGVLPGYVVIAMGWGIAQL